MYQFTIYNISPDNLCTLGRNSPPGRTKLEIGKPTFKGSWIDGSAWIGKTAETLPVGKYVCVATNEGILEPQGIWVFTVQETTLAILALDFTAIEVGGGVEAGV